MINPESEEVRKEVPELRIFSDDRWAAVKRQQEALAERNCGVKVAPLMRRISIARIEKNPETRLDASSDIRSLVGDFVSDNTQFETSRVITKLASCSRERLCYSFLETAI